MYIAYMHSELQGELRMKILWKILYIFPPPLHSYREDNFETLCISSGNNHLVNQRVVPVNTGTKVDNSACLRDRKKRNSMCKTL